MNIINVSEFYYILHRKSPIMAREKVHVLIQFGMTVIDVRHDDVLWTRAAEIKTQGGLSLADAFAMATAMVTNSSLVVGSDKEFNDRGVPIIRIRDS